MEFIDKTVFSLLKSYASSGKKTGSLSCEKNVPIYEESFSDYWENNHFTAGFGKAIMLPEDIDTEKYYIAGYKENNPARGVLDPQYAHAFYLDDNSGKGKALFISLDVVGLLNKDVNDIKKFIRDITNRENIKLINIFCTHNHAGIDTMGIWGKLPFSGKDPKFMAVVRDAVRKSVIDAIENKKNGRLYLGKVKVPDMQEDIRTPVVYSDILTRLRFAPDDNSGDIYFINFASHSESLQGCNHLVSADFPGYMRERIRKKTGAETIYGVGAIGGMISMKIDGEKQLRDEHRLAENTRNIGYKLADYAFSITDETEIKPAISHIRKEFYIPAENPVLTAAGKIKILDVDRYSDITGKVFLKTEMTFIVIDFLNILMLPCELFPELAYGGYLNAEESATGKGAEVNPVPLTEIINDDNLLIFGLANDELGYVLPPNDFLLNNIQPYMDKAIDKHGRRHYEETNSIGPETAKYIADCFSSIIDKYNSHKG